MATYNFNTSAPEVSTQQGQRTLLGKSFTYMFLFVLFTVAVSIGISMIFEYGIADAAARSRAYTITLIASAITQIILTVFIVFSSLKQGKTAIIPMLLYSACMGVLISSFGQFLNWWTIASAFGIAALAFGGMALIGLFSKNATGMGMIGMGLLFSVISISIFNIIFAILLPGVWLIQNIIASVIIVIAIMLITAYDVYNIRKISEAGMNSSNLALYLAFNLYIDFIIILVRILQLIIIFGGSDRR